MLLDDDERTERSEPNRVTRSVARVSPAKLPGYAPTLLAYHRAFASELRALIAGLPLRPGDRVLDLACGDGVYARWLAERVGEGGRVLAVDLSPAFLELARREVCDGRAMADRVTFARADLRHLPIPDDSFDLVWCAQSLYSLPDPVDALRRMERAARPGGIVAVFENDEFHHVLLPWPVEVELALRQAELAALTSCRRSRRSSTSADTSARSSAPPGWPTAGTGPGPSIARHPWARTTARTSRAISPTSARRRRPTCRPRVRDEFERLVDPDSPAPISSTARTSP